MFQQLPENGAQAEKLIQAGWLLKKSHNPQLRGHLPFPRRIRRGQHHHRNHGEPGLFFQYLQNLYAVVPRKVQVQNYQIQRLSLGWRLGCRQKLQYLLPVRGNAHMTVHAVCAHSLPNQINIRRIIFRYQDFKHVPSRAVIFHPKQKLRLLTAKDASFAREKKPAF